MERHTIQPRDNFEEIVSSQGVVFFDTPQPDGTVTKYWPEDAFYTFSYDEVTYLEGVTEKLHRMCREAVDFLTSGELGTLGLPEGTFELVQHSLAQDPPSIYGRFDLHYAGYDEGPAKLLEYNADTPTGLVEAAVAQWFWAQDTHPDRDQWNSLHERLIEAWRSVTDRLPSRVHFAHLEAETSGEEWMTVAYMRDVSAQAGLETVGCNIESIGWDSHERCFVDLEDAPITACFKLYPWENMLAEEFGAHVRREPDMVTWIEPLWKVVLSNKALLAALWHLYPRQENLLPALVQDDPPRGLSEWIAKPLHGREGDSMFWHTLDGDGRSEAQNWGPEGFCYQEWCPLPTFDGEWRPVLGSWVVQGKPAGLGIRESKAHVTDNFARFIPHVIDAPAPSQEKVQALLQRESFPLTPEEETLSA